MYRHTSAIMCFVICMLTYGCKSDASHASTYNTSKHAYICLQIFASKKDEGAEKKAEGAEKKAELHLRSSDTLQTVC